MKVENIIDHVLMTVNQDKYQNLIDFNKSAIKLVRSANKVASLGDSIHFGMDYGHARSVLADLANAHREFKSNHSKLIGSSVHAKELVVLEKDNSGMVSVSDMSAIQLSKAIDETMFSQVVEMAGNQDSAIKPEVFMRKEEDFLSEIAGVMDDISLDGDELEEETEKLILSVTSNHLIRRYKSQQMYAVATISLKDEKEKISRSMELQKDLAEMLQLNGGKVINRAMTVKLAGGVDQDGTVDGVEYGRKFEVASAVIATYLKYEENNQRLEGFNSVDIQKGHNSLIIYYSDKNLQSGSANFSDHVAEVIGRISHEHELGMLDIRIETVEPKIFGLKNEFDAFKGVYVKNEVGKILDEMKDDLSY